MLCAICFGSNYKEGWTRIIPKSYLNYYLCSYVCAHTPRPNRAVGSIQWTNTFDFKILKYTIKIIENAKFQNILACTLFVMVIFGYLRGQFFWNFFVFSWIFSDFFCILGSKSVQKIKKCKMQVKLMLRI